MCISRSRIFTYNEYSFAVYNKYSTFCRRILHFKKAPRNVFFFFFHFYHFFIYTYVLVRRVLSWRKDLHFCALLTKIHIFWYTCHEYQNSKIRLMGKQSVLLAWDRYYRFGSFDYNLSAGQYPKNTYI